MPKDDEEEKYVAAGVTPKKGKAETLGNHQDLPDQRKTFELEIKQSNIGAIKSQHHPAIMTQDEVRRHLGDIDPQQQKAQVYQSKKVKSHSESGTKHSDLAIDFL